MFYLIQPLVGLYSTCSRGLIRPKPPRGGDTSQSTRPPMGRVNFFQPFVPVPFIHTVYTPVDPDRAVLLQVYDGDIKRRWSCVDVTRGRGGRDAGAGAVRAQRHRRAGHR
eukprot:1030249-Prorocentrum_minimum.AAC.1